MKADELKEGMMVYVSRGEEYWDEPYVRKRHHTPKIKSVILRVEVMEIGKGEFERQFLGKLTDNNGFDKDGQTFVFNILELLCNQNQGPEKLNLGIWSNSPNYVSYQS